MKRKNLTAIVLAGIIGTAHADCTRTQETTLKQTLNIQTQEYQLETIHIAPTTKPTTPYAKHADKNGTPLNQTRKYKRASWISTDGTITLIGLCTGQDYKGTAQYTNRKQQATIPFITTDDTI